MPALNAEILDFHYKFSQADTVNVSEIFLALAKGVLSWSVLTRVNVTRHYQLSVHQVQPFL